MKNILIFQVRYIFALCVEEIFMVFGEFLMDLLQQVSQINSNSRVYISNPRTWKWIVSEFLQAKRGSSPPGWLLQWKKSSMQVNLDMFYLQGLVLRWAFIHKEAQIGPSYISFYLFRHPEVQTYWMIFWEENLRRKWQKW